MVVVQCCKDGCNWSSSDRPEALAAVLAAELQNHTVAAHGSNQAPDSSGSKKCPNIERPKITTGGTEEIWAVFLKKWRLFKSGSSIAPSQLNTHLFQCCTDSLGDDLLRGLSDVTIVTKDDLLAAIKRLAVQPVARGVRRTELLNMQQDSGETIRSFHAKVKGRALTCSYTIKCKCSPATDVDCTELVIKDVILNGIADADIKKEISWGKKRMLCEKSHFCFDKISMGLVYVPENMYTEKNAICFSK